MCRPALAHGTPLGLKSPPMSRIPASIQPQSVSTPRGTALPAPEKNTTPKPLPEPSAWGAKALNRQPASALSSLDGTLHDVRASTRGPLNFPASVAGVPVQSAREIEYQGLTGSRELMNRGADVRFGRLTQAQFDTLKAEFGGQSRVRFDPAREYTAVDFLPPALQGLVGKDLDTGSPVEIAGSEALGESMQLDGNVTVGATPNCHGTAWEAARAYQGLAGAHVQLAYGDATTAEGLYLDEFRTVATAAPGAQLDLSNLKPGDVVTFTQPDGMQALLHSAVYAGGGLFFEKPDTEVDAHGETAYRLVTFDQVTAPITDYLGSPPAVTALRPKENLAPPAQAFTAGDQGAELESLLRQRGETLGKPVVLELILGMGGSVRGVLFNAVLTRPVSTDAQGLGVVR